MSAEVTPIPPNRFAAALNDLPISSLYAKYAELRNQIQHLESSNAQLEDFARDHNDRDCYEALMENKQVIKRFHERIELVKKEVNEVRGLPWRPQEEEGTAPVAAPAGLQDGTANRGAVQNGTAGENVDDEDGVFL